MKTKMKADTKRTVVMSSQIFYGKSTAPSSSNCCRLADLDLDSWSLRESLTVKTSKSKYVFLTSRMQETKNLLTDADSRTDTIEFFHQEIAGDGRAL